MKLFTVIALLAALAAAAPGVAPVNFNDGALVGVEQFESCGSDCDDKYKSCDKSTTSKRESWYVNIYSIDHFVRPPWLDLGLCYRSVGKRVACWTICGISNIPPLPN